jgi:hypothetical protein
MPRHAKIVGVLTQGKSGEKKYLVVDFDTVVNARGHDAHVYKNDVYNLKKSLNINNPEDTLILKAIILQALCVDTGVAALHVESYQITMEVSQAKSTSDYVELLKGILDSVDVVLSPWGPQNLA